MNRGNALAFTISLIFIYLFLFQPHPSVLGEEGVVAAFFHSRIDWPEVWFLFRHLKPLPLLGALSMLLLSLVIRGWRWATIARSLSPVSFSLMFHLTNLGYMCNNLLPMRLGEVIRAGALSAKSTIRFSGSMATVVLERLLDLLSALAGLFLLLLIMPEGIQEHGMVVRFRSLFPLMALGAGSILAALLALVVWRDPVLRGFRRGAAFLPEAFSVRLLRILNAFAMGLSALRSPRRAILLLFQSSLIFYCYLFSLSFMVRAFGMESMIFTGGEISAILLILVFVTLGYTIPAAPGAVGTVQYFTAMALGLLGASETAAQGFAIGNHLLTWLVLTIMGFLAVPILGLSMKDLMKFKGEKA